MLKFQEIVVYNWSYAPFPSQNPTIYLLSKLKSTYLILPELGLSLSSFLGALPSFSTFKRSLRVNEADKRSLRVHEEQVLTGFILNLENLENLENRPFVEKVRENLE